MGNPYAAMATLTERRLVVAALCALLCTLSTTSETRAHSWYGDDFVGIGIGADWRMNDANSPVDVLVTFRDVQLGLIGIGWMGDVVYTPVHHHHALRLGGELYAGMFGLQFSTAWHSEQGLGFGARGILLVPETSPIFVTAGGQQFAQGKTEWLLGVSIMFGLDGEGFHW
ncbi:MAG: hypothetical protein ACON3Z_18540 [Bradymonadia bacterium]